MSLQINKKITKIILGIVGCLLLAVATYFVLSAIEGNISDKVAEDDWHLNTIEHEGEEYIPRLGITSYLITGVDNAIDPEGSGYFRNSANADFVAVLVVDTNKKTYSVLQLDRDTVCEINMIGIGGGSAGTVNAQLALSHTYGSGRDDSSKNVLLAVKNLLLGTDIDHYITFDLDAIAIANDSVGGVYVTMEEDMGGYYKGETVLLLGSAAVDFVRARGGTEDPTNKARMGRHRAYIDGFIDAVTSDEASTEKVTSLYSDLADRLVSDVTVSEASSLSKKLETYTFGGFYVPDGKSVYGEYAEFYVDDDNIRDIVIELFYEKKDKTE